MTTLLSHCELIDSYLEVNGFTRKDLARSTHLPLAKVDDILAHDRPITLRLARGVNRLIPQLSVDFIVKYEKKYREETRR